MGDQQRTRASAALKKRDREEEEERKQHTVPETKPISIELARHRDKTR